MPKTIKKLLKIFIIVALTLIISVVAVASSKEISNLHNTIKERETTIEQLEKKFEEQEKSKNETVEEKEKIKKDYEEIKNEYEQLEQKYLEEITPVSYDPNNLWSSSNASVYDMAVALEGTGLESLASTYVRAEKEWGVNAIFLASLTAEESAWGMSNRARTQNNLSGFAVYSSSAQGTTFSSKEESIMATAELICNSYLKPTGAYHNGISIYSVNLRYCPDDGGNWSSNISSIANSLVSKINNL